MRYVHTLILCYSRWLGSFSQWSGTVLGCLRQVCIVACCCRRSLTFLLIEGFQGLTFLQISYKLFGRDGWQSTKSYCSPCRVGSDCWQKGAQPEALFPISLLGVAIWHLSPMEGDWKGWCSLLGQGFLRYSLGFFHSPFPCLPTERKNLQGPETGELQVEGAGPLITLITKLPAHQEHQLWTIMWEISF